MLFRSYRCTGVHPFKTVRPPPIEVWIVCKSWSQSIAIQKKLWALLPKDEIAPDTEFSPKNGFAGVQKAVVFKNGSIIRIKTIGQDTLDLESATIHLVWIDEPLGDEETFGALQARLRRTGGEIMLTMTPATTGDLSWLRKLCDDNTVRDLHFTMEPANFIPVGSDRPLKTEDGVPMDAAWIEAERTKTLSWMRGVRCDGDWEYASINKAFEAFHRGRHVIPNLATSGLLSKQVEVNTGIDYGEDALRTCGMLVYVDRSGTYPRIFVMGEYVPQQGTTMETDADGLLDMLARCGDKWSTQDHVWADKRYEGRTTKKNARALSEAVARRLAITGELKPTIRVAKRGLKRDHLWASIRWLHEAMLRPGHFYVDESCAWLIEALEKWKGGEKEIYKDVIDALRYALRHLWGGHAEAKPERYARAW